MTGARAEDVRPGGVDSIADGAAADADTTTVETSTRNRRRRFRRSGVVGLAVLPALAMLLTVAAGYLKYQHSVTTDSQSSAMSSVQAATEGSIALLSYAPDTAQAKLTAARDLLTGGFRDSYTSLTNDVVIPGAQQKKISAVATVPAASSISASADHAVVLVFIDQTVIVGNDAPTGTASAVQVTLERAGNRWLISGFDPK